MLRSIVFALSFLLNLRLKHVNLVNDLVQYVDGECIRGNDLVQYVDGECIRGNDMVQYVDWECIIGIALVQYVKVISKEV